MSESQVENPVKSKYENLSFLQKKWLSNAKSQTLGYTMTKFEHIVLPTIP